MPVYSHCSCTYSDCTYSLGRLYCLYNHLIILPAYFPKMQLPCTMLRASHPRAKYCLTSLIDRAVTVLVRGNFMQPFAEHCIALLKGHLEIISSLLLVNGFFLPRLASDAYFQRFFLEGCCMHKVRSICARATTLKY